MEHQNWSQETSREVAEAKRRLEGIVNSAMDAIITIDEQQNIVLFNPAAQLMFGVSDADALGQPIARFIPARFREGHGEHIRRFRKTGVTGRRMGALGAISGVRADGEEFPIEASISQVDIGGERLATVILRDITERKANEEARLLLAREVDHRAKNALAVVQALVSLTTAATKEEFVAAISGRVSALARAHSLLAVNRWRGANLAQVIGDETAAYQKPGQVQLQGSNVLLTPNAVQPIGLIIHELATNAVKYGSLSISAGRVSIVWSILPSGSLQLSWSEAGGPPVIEPTSLGFGSTMITAVAARQLGGKISIQWRPEGIIVTAVLPPTTYGLDQLPDPVPPDERDDNRPYAQKLGRLLLVEDETLVAMELAQGLRASGWEIIGPASSLEEAFDLLSENDPPDAAVLDINLNGEPVYPLADLLQTRRVPFLFCSGYEAMEDQTRYRDYPMVRKPTSLRILLAELGRISLALPR